MELREAVEKYLQLAGSYGTPLPLGAFGLSREDTERFFSALDEDYHISRFIHLSTHSEAWESFQINGFSQTHVAIGQDIQSIL